ncbi:hypothetical protein STBA_38740 [Streptomyces sp. MP131-18]|nr:hypothetical protein STBA_38740 [Streptomyces sp. MP131-18]
MPSAAHAVEVETALFAAGAEAAERVRNQVKAGHRLPFEVIALEWDNSRARQAAVLSWPHCALKRLYTPIGVLFRKFPPRSSDAGTAAEWRRPPRGSSPSAPRSPHATRTS